MQTKPGGEPCYSLELVFLIYGLLSENPAPVVQEQCYCALSNACATSYGQNCVISNPEALVLIRKGLQHPDTAVESAAVHCVINLARDDDDHEKQYMSASNMPFKTFQQKLIFLLFSGGLERQKILMDMNFQKELKNLMNKEDKVLFER